MNYPLDWDKLRVFHACAEAGSFTKAAEHLNITQSAISRQIGSLEYDLKLQLFTRHPRGLILTEQGEALYKMAHNIIIQLKDVQEVLTDIKNQPKGSLRITAPVAFGTHWIINKLTDFQKLYKDINLDLLLDDTELDLYKREADAAIRLYKPHQADIIYRLLFDIKLHIYASVNYIKQYGIPADLEDLKNHFIISYGERVPIIIKNLNWLENNFSYIKPRLKVNNLWAIKTAVHKGLGLAVLPDYLVDSSDNLVAILPDKTNIVPFTVYFCYHEALKNSARVRVFNDFIFAKAKEKN